MKFMAKNIFSSMEAKLYLLVVLVVIAMIAFAIIFSLLSPTPTSIEAPLPHGEISTPSDSI